MGEQPREGKWTCALCAEKDAQIAAMSKDMVKIAGMVDSANERIEAMTKEWDADIAELKRERQRVDERNRWLAECYRLTGADTDGDEDWRIAPFAVAEVRRLRADSDQDESRLIDIRAQLSALQRAAREYMEATDAYTAYLQDSGPENGECERHDRAEQALLDLLKS